MSTTVEIILDTKNEYAVQAFLNAMSSFLMHANYDHNIKVQYPLKETNQISQPL